MTPIVALATLLAVLIRSNVARAAASLPLSDRFKEIPDPLVSFRHCCGVSIDLHVYNFQPHPSYMMNNFGNYFDVAPVQGILSIS